VRMVVQALTTAEGVADPAVASMHSSCPLMLVLPRLAQVSMSWVVRRA